VPPARSGPIPAKACTACGRDITWRKKWERDWESVRYCSKACRARGVTEVDRLLERAILDLLADRDASASICPAEAARRVDPSAWRELMEPARRAARRLAYRGVAQITQRGHPVDPSTTKGPIRVRLSPPDR